MDLVANAHTPLPAQLIAHTYTHLITHTHAQRKEAKEVAEMMGKLAKVQKGAKKDVSEAAGKSYNPHIVEATWWVVI